MGEGFNSFKKRILKEFYIKTSVISVSLGLLVFGLFFLLSKLEVISLNVLLCLLFGVLTMGLVFLGLFFLFKPNDKKIAKRLDESFSLNEKVQTMVEYKDDNSFIVALQREDTDKKLKGIPLKNLKFKISIFMIVAAVLGVGLSVTAIAYPSINNNIEDKEEPEKEYTLSELQIIKLQALMKQIDASKMNSDMKIKYKAEIELLIKSLETPIKESKLIEKVKATINNVMYHMSQANTNRILGRSLFYLNEYYYENNKVASGLEVKDYANVNFTGMWKNKENEKDIINIGIGKITYLDIELTFESCSDRVLVGSYIKSTATSSGDKLTVTLTINDDGTLTDGEKTFTKCDDYSKLKSLGNNMYNYKQDDASQVLSLLIAKEYDGLYKSSILGLRQKLLADSIGINNALDDAKLIEDDSLYIMFKKYVDALSSSSNIGDDELSDHYNLAISELRTALDKTLSLMSENKRVAYLVEKELCNIFGLEAPVHNDDELSNGESDGISGDNDSDELDKNDPNKGGSIGSGDSIYASTDIIYDYQKGVLEEYGKYYEEYNNIIMNLINEGNLPEEVEKYLKAYFDKLVTGIDD